MSTRKLMRFVAMLGRSPSAGPSALYATGDLACAASTMVGMHDGGYRLQHAILGRLVREVSSWRGDDAPDVSSPNSYWEERVVEAVCQAFEAAPVPEDSFVSFGGALLVGGRSALVVTCGQVYALAIHGENVSRITDSGTVYHRFESSRKDALETLSHSDLGLAKSAVVTAAHPDPARSVVTSQLINADLADAIVLTDQVDRESRMRDQLRSGMSLGRALCEPSADELCIAVGFAS